ncbi:hypothetical protein [Flavobacterium sp.]|uniref:hypothetical protein n=1 Tax=Flavobacterium sp. TaxID=239 RepID=UPI00286BE3E4|nr:hypothetical protein [Flavobacterium sp.]
MKITLLKYLIIFFTLTSCKNNETNDKVLSKEVDTISNPKEEVKIKENISLDGEWEFVYNPNNDDLPDLVFTLSVQKTNSNEFIAQYCAIAQKGNRIDCSNDEEFNVKGVINGNKIEATFYSFFDNKKMKGNVELMLLDDDTFQWTITKKPSSEFYAPTKCLLKKKKEASEVKEVATNKRNSLPFDFDKYNNVKDKSGYEVYSSDELSEIAKIINDQVNEFPARIFLIDNGNLPFETYVIETDGDSITQILVNIKDSKVLSNEIIGYESDNNNTFIINRDLSVNMYKIDINNNSKSVTKTLQIKKDGNIVKI